MNRSESAEATIVIPRRLPAWLAPTVVFVVALFALVPTTGDIGLTWDEPSYRYSQILSEQWWEQLIHARSVDALTRLFAADALLYYWPYGRFGINFHPPLAGQLNLLTYEVFGQWMKDIPARRMASVIEFALTLVILYQFFAQRYGAWVGGVTASALLLMPRLYGDAHIAGTDTPGLLLWTATTVAFWKGLNEPNARVWRVGVGVLLGLAFVEKMGAVMVALPLILWIVFGPLMKLFSRRNTRADWIDGVLTSTAMLVPLGLAYREIARLSEAFFVLQREAGFPETKLSVAMTNLFTDHPQAQLPAGILLVPLALWIVRRGLGLLFRKSPIWGVERPALETWNAMLAFGPVVAWLGNPAWWRETLPRLAHYYAISTGRRGALPDIKILYFGNVYEYSLPWPNAWVLIAITVPVGILLAAIVGLISRLFTIRRDALPAFCFLHLIVLPVLRMLPTPAHDGVRLFLPTFIFLAAFAGWGVVDLANRVVRSTPARVVLRSILALLVLAPAAWSLIRVHPYELSYYNELIGGPKGAWAAGFELSYWYDAFNDETLNDLNRLLPDGTAIDTFNPLSSPPTFSCLQELGLLKGSLIVGAIDSKQYPSVYVLPKDPQVKTPTRLDFALWMLTHDSKASALTRLAFAMTPIYERRPRQLDGLRVVTVDSHQTLGRAWALQLLTDPGADLDRPAPPAAPAWVRFFLPPLARLWGDGITRSKPLRVNEPIFTWAKTNPSSLRSAARALVETKPDDPNPITNPDVTRLRDLMTRRNLDGATRLNSLLRVEPQVLFDAVEILIARPDDVRTVLTRFSYTDPSAIGGPLDRNLNDGSQ